MWQMKSPGCHPRSSPMQFAAATSGANELKERVGTILCLWGEPSSIRSVYL